MDRNGILFFYSNLFPLSPAFLSLFRSFLYHSQPFISSPVSQPLLVSPFFLSHLASPLFLSQIENIWFKHLEPKKKAKENQYWGIGFDAPRARTWVVFLRGALSVYNHVVRIIVQ